MIRDRRQGFTILELIVAIGLFSTVTSIAIGGFAAAMRAQRQAGSLITANSNISLVLEQMTREMRTGFDFCVNGQSCPSVTEVSFKNARSEVVTYCLSGDAVLRGVGGGACGAGNFERITADAIAVRHLRFYLRGNVAGDNLQPRITIAIGVSPREQALTGNIINLQTSASPRLPIDS